MFKIFYIYTQLTQYLYNIKQIRNAFYIFLFIAN